MSRIQRLLLSVLSGVLLSLAWLGFPGWILFIAFIPLFRLEEFFVVNKSDYKSVSLWSHAFLTFIIWNALTTWWICYATIEGAMMAVLANSFIMSLVWWLGHSARRALKSNLGYISLVVFWISFEFFHFHWDIEWPWLDLGNGFANSIKMIQWYEFTGVLGGTLWVLLMNIILYAIYRNVRDRQHIIRIIFPGVAAVLLLVIPVIYSLITYNSYSEKKDPLEVVIVQPNIDPYSEEYSSAAELQKLNKFINLASEKADAQTDLVVGPETVFERYSDWNVDRLTSNYLYTRLIKWMMKYANAEIVLGASTSKIYPGVESASATARRYDSIYYDVFNSAVFIGRRGDVQIYHKSILVPGVEKMPYRKYLGFLNDLVFNLGGTTGSLGSQEEPTNFILKDGKKVAPVICYESAFGEYLAKFVRKGAGLVIVITNDGWWRDTPGYKQHLSYSRLRAVESRRSVVRSANTGISALINQRGDIIEHTSWWREASVKGTVNMNDELTFYVKYGDYIGRISLFTGVLLLLLLIARKLTTIKAFNK